MIEILQQSVAIAVTTQGRPGANGKGFGAQYRPGDSPEAFTGSLVGAATDVPPLSASGVALDMANGRTYTLTSPGTIALRDPIWLEPEAFFALRMAFFRSADPPQYDDGTAFVGVQWLDAAFAAISSSIVKLYQPLAVRDALQIVTARVPSRYEDGVDLTPPPGAIYWRPFFTSGSAGGTIQIEGMTISDVTNAGVYAPDVSRLAARVSALEARLKNLGG